MDRRVLGCNAASSLNVSPYIPDPDLAKTKQCRFEHNWDKRPHTPSWTCEPANVCVDTLILVQLEVMNCCKTQSSGMT